VSDPGTGKVWDLLAHLRGLGPEVDEEQVIVVARDVTEVTALQESLRRSETLAALGAMVAGVAQQVRNPLFGHSAALDAFAARYGDRDELQRYADAIREPAARLARLLQQLVDYARPPGVERARLDLRQLAGAAAIACAAEAAKRTVAVEVAAGEPVPVLGDRDRLQGALAGVIENAVQASPAGASVEVSVSRETRSGAESALCRVRDRGDGFRPEDIPHLGEPFFARRFGGTGLGLAQVHRVVFDHGGALRFANAPGGGAEVEIILPCVAGEER
jgi:signal transduction histidine kinase